MSQGTALAREQATGRYPIEAFLADIAGIDWTMDATDLKRRSRDYYWYSPILNEELKDKPFFKGLITCTPPF